jgi:hypothetical protein
LLDYKKIHNNKRCKAKDIINNLLACLTYGNGKKEIVIKINNNRTRKRFLYSLKITINSP